MLSLRLQRRQFLRASVGAIAAAGFGTSILAGCSNAAPSAAPAAVGAAPAPLLGFDPVAKSLADAVRVPPGYSASVLIAVGDPLSPEVTPYRNDGSDADFEQRCGEWHDGMEYFGLSGQGRPDPAASDRALLAINHEWVSPGFLHAAGPSAPPRPAAEVDTETAAMGVTVVEIAREADGRFRYVTDSPFNRRITTRTPIELSGPVRGHRKLRTRYSPDGTRVRGTVNNCGTGRTPWGTLLTGEENWSAFFSRDAADGERRTDAENHALERYGRPAGAKQAYAWDTVPGGAERHRRWNTSVSGTSADGSDDHRNEINGQGWVTEIDPYDPRSVIRKRSLLGRMAHEGAAFSVPTAGSPLSVYMGDDARGEYVYRFVSAAAWDPADADTRDRMATGDRYLDAGTLYAARFDEDGRGEWLPLRLSNPAVAGFRAYRFEDDADVLLHARLAADAAGATRMDRPEWGSVDPETGDVYITLTNNSQRVVDAESPSAMTVDAVNPRAYEDQSSNSDPRQGNVNGHILRLADDAPGSTGFRWDIYLFGAESDADASRINLSGLTAEQDFSGPDGIGFAASTGICWIQTDDSAMSDQSNCMMLAALPGRLGDGEAISIDHGGVRVATRRGAKPGPETLKRFLVGPVDQEITGIAETPMAALCSSTCSTRAAARRSTRRRTRIATPATGPATPATAPVELAHGRARPP
ncbi:MAG: DUF839 domain-containing protein [Gammaproteobacteria bacterium]|nr:DUF839 domain-containing protein [Gammaproteobacteria bacterium]